MFLCAVYHSVVLPKSLKNLSQAPVRFTYMTPLPPCRPGDKRIAALKTAEDVRALFKDIFPAFLPAVREVRTAATACCVIGWGFSKKMNCHGPGLAKVKPHVHDAL